MESSGCLGILLSSADDPTEPAWHRVATTAPGVPTPERGGVRAGGSFLAGALVFVCCAACMSMTQIQPIMIFTDFTTQVPGKTEQAGEQGWN